MPDDVVTVGLYDQDFFAWGFAQARALRAARDAILQADLRSPKLRQALGALDWENLAEEIEGLARRDRRELTSRVITIMEHLLKLQFSPAGEPRAAWAHTVRRERDEVREILRDSPSLRREVVATITRKQGDVVRHTLDDLIARGEITRAAATTALATGFSEDQVLDDWIPEPLIAAPSTANVRRPRRKP
jgi:hypothetical protein